MIVLEMGKLRAELLVHVLCMGTDEFMRHIIWIHHSDDLSASAILERGVPIDGGEMREGFLQTTIDI